MALIVIRKVGGTAPTPVDETNLFPVEVLNNPVFAPLGVVWDAFESITVSSTALRLTAGTFDDADVALITVESQAVRYRMDGGDVPTASAGHQLEAGDIWPLTDPDQLEKFRVIRRDGADSTLRVSYGHYVRA